jgi:tripartite-type tricarboxylate transporter receptor subunit TctC
MKLPRRKFLKLASAAALMPAAPTVARAQAGYPNHPVRIIVGQAAGSSSDIAARLIGQWLTEKTGGQFIVETRPGAAGNIATDFVAHAPGDGYTLLLINAQNTINATLYDKPGFDFQRDIVPVAGFNRVLLVMEVHPSFPAKTVPEFIAYAKANPGKVNMASAGIGGPQHAAGEMFKYLAGVDLLHVPYRGSTPAITDLIGGQVQVMFDVTPTAVPQIKGGKLRALGVSSLTRIPALPDVPPIADTVKGYEASAWIGIGAPRETPAEIVAMLNKQITASLKDDTIKQRLADLGAEAQPQMDPAAFAKYVADDIGRWAKVIKAAGMKPG